jgi:hypothetical protein
VVAGRLGDCGERVDLLLCELEVSAATFSLSRLTRRVPGIGTMAEQAAVAPRAGTAQPSGYYSTAAPVTWSGLWRLVAGRKGGTR